MGGGGGGGGGSVVWRRRRQLDAVKLVDATCSSSLSVGFFFGVPRRRPAPPDRPPFPFFNDITHNSNKIILQNTKSPIELCLLSIDFWDTNFSLLLFGFEINFFSFFLYATEISSERSLVGVYSRVLFYWIAFHIDFFVPYRSGGPFFSLFAFLLPFLARPTSFSSSCQYECRLLAVRGAVTFSIRFSFCFCFFFAFFIFCCCCCCCCSFRPPFYLYFNISSDVTFDLFLLLFLLFFFTLSGPRSNGIEFLFFFWAISAKRRSCRTLIRKWIRFYLFVCFFQISAAPSGCRTLSGPWPPMITPTLHITPQITPSWREP